MSNLVLGIDLGTTNSVASIWNGNNYTLIKNGNSYIFPSVIEFTEKGKIVCNNNYNYNNSIKNVKRFIGRDLTDVNILKFLNDLNFDCEIIDNNLKVFNKFEDKYYTLEELNSLILKFIISKANKQLNDQVKDVVITIPAHFNQIQRDSIIISSKIANLNCIRIINEPTAAALAYGLNIHNDVNVLIFDLGGGTFDLSILNIDDGMYDVIATQGDNLLGGSDFTKVIMNDILTDFKKENEFYKLEENILKNNLSKLKDVSNKFKCNLVDNVLIKNFYNDDNNNINLDLEYKKKRYEITNLFSDLINRIENHLQIILSSSNLSKDQIDYILLVGGSTKLLEIRNFVASYFNKDPIYNINPDTVVSIGAAIQGFSLNNPTNLFSTNLALVDVLPLSIGVESDDGQMTKIIKKGYKLPCKKFKLFSNDEDWQKEISINIYQGERQYVKDNVLIGTFKLNKIIPQKKGKNVIKIEISVDNNCMIKVIASEKGNDNINKISIEKDNYLYSDELIQQMIKDAEKYDEIDTLKIKMYKMCNKLNKEINNMQYNCNNNSYINLKDNEKILLNKHIQNVTSKKDILMGRFQAENITNEDFKDAIQEIKKLLKVNEKTYPMFINTYDNDNNKNLEYDKYDIKNYENTEFVKNELNNNLIIEINHKINTINKSSNLSKYAKNMIISYLKNITFKLDSILLDDQIYNKYLNNIESNIKYYQDNDQEMINNYGNLNIISNLLQTHNINYDMMNFYNLNSLQIFDLMYDISQQFNIELD